MNFGSDLLLIKDTLVAANNLFPFSELLYRGGSETKILEVAYRLYYGLEKKGYLSVDGVSKHHVHDMRKICFFLFLNADFKTLEELVDNVELGHLIWTTPTISKCLLCDIVWSLQLDRYLREIISFCTPKFSVEVVQCFASSIRYATPDQSHKRVSVLLSGIYNLTSNLEKLRYDNSTLTQILTDLSKAFSSILTWINTPPNRQYLEKLDDEGLFKYKGELIMTLLQLTNECMQVYLGEPRLTYEGCFIFALTNDEEQEFGNEISPSKPCDTSESVLRENYQTYNQLLMNTCEEQIMDVSIDIFCCWSENEVEPGLSLQRAIGELAFKLNKTITQNKLEHTVSEKLSAISTKPIELEDIMQNADSATLIENASKKGKDQAQWIHALINKPEFYMCEEFVDCVSQNVELCSADGVEKLCEEILNILKGDEKLEHGTKLKDLGLTAFLQLPFDKREQYMKRNFEESTFNNIFEREDYEREATEIFNKMANVSERDFLRLNRVFLQNPEKTYTKILKEGIQNCLQGETALHILRVFVDFEEYRYAGDDVGTLKKVTGKLFDQEIQSEKERKGFVYLITRLCQENLIDSDDVFKLVMAKICANAAKKDFSTVHLHLQVLWQLFHMDSDSGILACCVPLLGAMGRLMEAARQNVDPTQNFSLDAVETLVLAIDLQQSIFKLVLPTIADSQSDNVWLKNCLCDVSPLNAFYFRHLWKRGETDFLECLLEQQDVDTVDTSTLYKILMNSTPEEWKLVWRCLRSRVDGEDGALSSLMKVVMLAALVTRNIRPEAPSTQSAAWLKYSYRCFAPIATEYIPSIKTTEQTNDFISKLVTLINIHNADGSDETSNIFLPVFLSIRDNCMKNVSLDKKELDIKTINSIKDELLKHRLLDMFKKEG